MPFTCTCRHCGATLRVMEHRAAAAIRCPRCGSDVPNPAEVSPELARLDGRSPLDGADPAGHDQPAASSEPEQYRDASRGATGFPWVTAAIVFLNVAAYAVAAVAGAGWLSRTGLSLIAWGGSYGPPMSQGQWWRLLTANYV